MHAEVGFMAERYWVGTNGDWDDTSNWSDSSGGSGGVSEPSASDDVYFDSNSGSGTATLVADVSVNTLNLEDNSGVTIDIDTHKLSIGSGMDIGTGNTLTANSTGNDVLEINIEKGSGTYRFNGTCSLTGELDIEQPTNEKTMYITGELTVENINFSNSTTNYGNICFKDIFIHTHKIEANSPRIHMQFQNAWIVFTTGGGTSSFYSYSGGDVDENPYEDLNFLIQNNFSGISYFEQLIMVNNMIINYASVTTNIHIVKNLYLTTGTFTLTGAQRVGNIYMGTTANLSNDIITRLNSTTTAPNIQFQSGLSGTFIVENRLYVRDLINSSGDVDIDLTSSGGGDITVNVRDFDIYTPTLAVDLKLSQLLRIGRVNVRGTDIEVTSDGALVEVMSKINHFYVDDYGNTRFSGGTVNVSQENIIGGAYRNEAN